jgi:DNA repair protein RAD16
LAKTEIVSEEEIILDSEDELEFQEQASPDESSESGSEFELSDNDSLAGSQDEDAAITEAKLVSYAQAIADDDMDAEDVLVDAAIQESLQTAQAARAIANGVTSAGVGSSGSKTRAPRNAASALRAAAAERRMSRAKEPHTSDAEFELSDEEEDAQSSMSDSPLSGRASKKGKGKAKGKGDDSHQTTWTNMSQTDRKRRQQENRAAARARKAQERKLIEKLGRRLTQVYLRSSLYLFRYFLTRTHREKKILSLCSNIIPN